MTNYRVRVRVTIARPGRLLDADGADELELNLERNVSALSMADAIPPALELVRAAIDRDLKCGVELMDDEHA